MPKIVADISMSLDGYVTGAGADPEHGLGDAPEIHAWVAEQDEVDSEILAGATAASGAVVMGRRLFDTVDSPHGWSKDMGYGADQAGTPPFFVVTHSPPSDVRLERELGMRFTFVRELEAAIAQARAATDGDVVIMGGGDVIGQALQEGIVDEFRVHLSPVVVGGGTPLFRPGTRQRYRQREVRPSSNAIHITYERLTDDGNPQVAGQEQPATSSRPLPPVTDRTTWQARIDELRVKEKIHTRAGDALAAERRRLPMVEVDPTTNLIGADGPVRLIDIFDGRSQLIAYFHMWHTGRPAAEQCEGCTFNTSHIAELSYLQSRDVSYAVFCEGPYEEASRYRDFMGYPVPWYSVPQDSVGRLVADRHFGILVCYLGDGDRVYETYWTTGRGDEVMAPSYGLLDRTVYGRQEFWEDSPEGWPQHWGSQGGQFRLDGRPTAQWSRIRAGRDDDFGPAPGGDHPVP